MKATRRWIVMGALVLGFFPARAFAVSLPFLMDGREIGAGDVEARGDGAFSLEAEPFLRALSPVARKERIASLRARVAGGRLRSEDLSTAGLVADLDEPRGPYGFDFRIHGGAECFRKQGRVLKGGLR